MNDEPALLAAIITAPDDDTPRLAYADFLDERGGPGDAHFAAYIRCNVALARGDETMQKAAREEIERNGWTWRDNPHAFGARFPGLKYRKRRGFVEAVRCTAEEFFRETDRLIWNSRQFELCPRCKGKRRVFEQVMRRGFLMNASRGKRCPECFGRGTVPRPCPQTAQPIRKVTITTDPRNEVAGWELASDDEIRRSLTETWFGIEFELPTSEGDGTGSASEHLSYP